jgi:hypothetical protein
MMIYHFNLGIDQSDDSAAEFDLPQEELWQARTKDEWAQLFIKAERTSRFFKAPPDTEQ